MLTAKELMIGDYGITEGHIVKVTAIYNNGKIGFDGDSINGISDHLESIPLTPEILEKNEFVKFIGSQYVLPKCSAGVILTKIKEMPNANGIWLVAIKNGYTDARIVITYVHELQHALRLCGVEKEIAL